MGGDSGELGRQGTAGFCCEQKEEIEKNGVGGAGNPNWSNRGKK